jgi:hypothetical protein
MHAKGQRAVTLPFCLTALIVRNLTFHGNVNISTGKNTLSESNLLPNSDIGGDYRGSDPFGNPITSYWKGTVPCEKICLRPFRLQGFQGFEFLKTKRQNRFRPCNVETLKPCHLDPCFPHITSFLLRRKAGTSRSLCSKLLAMAPRMVSSEMTSGLRSCATGTGAGSSI